MSFANLLFIIYTGLDKSRNFVVAEMEILSLKSLFFSRCTIHGFVVLDSQTYRNLMCDHIKIFEETQVAIAKVHPEVSSERLHGKFA